MSWSKSKPNLPNINPTNQNNHKESFLASVRRLSVMVLFFLLALIFAFGVFDVDLFRSSQHKKVLATVNGRSLIASKGTLLHQMYQKNIAYYENTVKKSLSQEERNLLLQQVAQSLVSHYTQFDYAKNLGYSFSPEVVLKNFVQFTKHSMGLSSDKNTDSLDESIISMLSSGSISRSSQGRVIEKYLQEASTVDNFLNEYFGFLPVSQSMIHIISSLYTIQKSMDLVVLLRSDLYQNFVEPKELDNFTVANKFGSNNSIYQGKSSDPKELKNFILSDFINANTKELDKRMNAFFIQKLNSLDSNPSPTQVSKKLAAPLLKTQLFGIDATRLSNHKGIPIQGIRKDEIQADLFSLSKKHPGKLFFFKDSLVWAKIHDLRQLSPLKSPLTKKSVQEYHQKLLKNQFLLLLQKSSTVSYPEYAK